MTTPPSLPVLAGLGWSRHKKPGFSTRIASHVSGREVRVALMEYPLYEFEAVYDGLASNATAAFAGLGAGSLQNLMGFFLQLQGQFGTFLYTDPDDCTVTAQAFGTGTGAATSYTMMRSLGGWLEPVGWVTAITNVYLNGTAQAGSAYYLTPPTRSCSRVRRATASPSRPTFPTRSTAAFSTTGWTSRSSCPASGDWKA